MARDTSVDLSETNPELDSDRLMNWSVPPVLSLDPADSEDQGFILTQGIVYQIINSKINMFQNISENEDDYIEFSLHGDRDGFWSILNTHSFLRIKGDFFLLNRSHKQNARVAVTKG